jgi:hypothetical protein
MSISTGTVGYFAIMAWPAEELTPEENEEIIEARKDIKAGVKAEDVWNGLGI